MKPSPFIDIHTHQKNPIHTDQSISLVNIFAQDFAKSNLKSSGFYSIGLHPWHIDESRLESDMKNVERALGEKSVIAVGEAGLDRITKAPLKTQHKVFDFHLQKAYEYKKPLIVHAVKSYPDIISVYKRSGVNVKLIIHGFSGNRQSAEQLREYGFYLSFGKALLDERKKAAEVLSNLPPESFFIESDDSAIDIVEIYTAASKIRDINIDALKKIIYQNFKNCFGDIL